MARPSDPLALAGSCVPDEIEPTFDLLTLNDITAMIDKLKGKRHSRIWFDPDVRLLNALIVAEDALETVASYLVVEGLELPENAA